MILHINRLATHYVCLKHDKIQSGNATNGGNLLQNNHPSKTTIVLKINRVRPNK